MRPVVLFALIAGSLSSFANLACAQVEEFKQSVSARADVATEVGLGSSQLFSINVANDFREVRSILSEKQIMRLRQLANQSALFLGDLVNAVRSSGLELTKREVRELETVDAEVKDKVERDLRRIRIEIFRKAVSDKVSSDEFDQMIGEPFNFPVPYTRTRGKVGLLRRAQFAFPVEPRGSRKICLNYFP